MIEFAGISTHALFGQLLLGLINGAFYALLSLGLAIIFGLLQLVNFAHGAFYMLGALTALLLSQYFGIGYWFSLFIAPLLIGAFGIVLERSLVRHLYKLDPLYGMLLTFGLALVIEGLLRNKYGVSGQPYSIPAELSGGQNLGFMFLPNYRTWVIVASIIVCAAVWVLIEKTRLGAYLRAATEKPQLVRAFGIDVTRLITLTFGFGVALAALAGVLAAPIHQINPLMGSNIIIVVFAVVVIGGLGSIAGAVVTGFGLGVVEGLTKVFYSEASSTVVFLVMIGVLLVRPTGLFGKPDSAAYTQPSGATVGAVLGEGNPRIFWIASASLLVFLMVAPHIFYSVFLMKALCFALFACAFNLLLGYTGLMSFGHAAFFGTAGYITAHAVKVWNWPPEIGLLAAVLGASAVGLVFGWLAIRRQGVYFGMITLALSQLIFFYALQVPFTGGEDGIQAVPRGMLFGILDLNNNWTMYYVVLAICVAGFAAIYRIIHSPFGEILQAIRENEPRAISLGYATNRFKLVAFVLSATFSGLAGGTKALVFQLAPLGDVHWGVSGEVLLMTLVGGVGTVMGPVVGAFVMVSMQHYLAQFGSWVLILQGVIFVFCVLVFRRGIVGEIAAFISSRRNKPALRRAEDRPALTSTSVKDQPVSRPALQG